MSTIAIAQKKSKGFISKALCFFRQGSPLPGLDSFVTPKGQAVFPTLRLLQKNRPDLSHRESNVAIARLAFATFITIIVAIGWQHPYYSHDMLCYIGSMLSIDNHNIEQVHAQTYSFAKANMAPKDYNELADGGFAFRRDITANAEHFGEQLPFFKVKPLYVLLLYGLYKLGLDPVHGSILISSVGCILCGLLTIHWLSRYLNQGAATMWAMALLLLAGILEFSAITTPDAFSSFTILASLYCVASKRSHTLTLSMMFLAMLIRMDNIVLLGLYLLYARFMVKDRIAIASAASWSLGAILLFLAVRSYSGYYGWQVHFYYSFVDRMTQPSLYTKGFTVAQYLSTIFYGLGVKPPCNMNLFFIFLFLVASLFRGWKVDRKDVLFRTICLSGIVSVVHYLIFPEPVPRFFFGYYLAVGIFFLERIYTTLPTKTQRGTERLEFNFEQVPLYRKEAVSQLS